MLPTFEVFARTRNFATTGSIMNLTRAAVHHRVATLEEVLGKPLYQRTRGVISLTDVGRELHRYACDVLKRRRELLRLAHAPLKARFACEPKLLPTVVPAIAQFERERYGELELLCVEGDDAVRAVLDDRADLAVIRRADRPRELSGRVLSRRAFVVAATADHPVLARRAVRVGDLEAHRVFVATHNAEAVPGAIAQPSNEVALAWAEASLGIAVVESYQRVPPSLRTRVVSDLPRISLRIVHSRVLHVLNAPFELRRILFEQLE